METIRESSRKSGDAHLTLHKYRNVHNISHYHREHELVFVHSGGMTVTVNGTAHRLPQGMGLFIRSGDVHYLQSDPGAISSVLKADSAYFEGLFANKQFRTPMIDPEFGVEAAYEKIRTELRFADEYSGTAADGIASALFVSLLRGKEVTGYTAASTHGRAAGEIYDTVREKIFREFATITFDAAAAYLHFSRPYFSKVFRTIFGMPFTQYLNTVRISAAVEKLQAGGMSITEIADSCGFNTIRNFNRVFKEFTGYSPRSLPQNYVFLRNLQDSSNLDPTLNCTEILE